MTWTETEDFLYWLEQFYYNQYFDYVNGKWNEIPIDVNSAIRSLNIKLLHAKVVFEK